MRKSWLSSLGFVGACLTFAAVLVVIPAQGLAREPQANESDVQDFVLFGDTRPVLVRLHIRIDDQPFPAVWDGFMRHLFNYLDINGDGNLDKDELERVPSAELLLGRGRGGFVVDPESRLRPRVPLAKNKDSKVTVAELADYYRKNGLPPLQLQIGATPKTMAPGRPFMNAMGKDPWGKPAKDEPTEPAAGTAVARTAFRLLNTTKDGKLTGKQLAAAPAALLRADRNDDDLVTLEEMEACALLQAAGPPDAGPVVLVRPDEPADELVRRLQDHYAPNKSVLTQKHLGLDDATFKLLDKNKDGELDKEELADFARRAPDLELTFRFSRKGLETQVELHGTGQPSPLVAKAREKEGTVELELGPSHVQLHPGVNAIRPDGLEGFIRSDLLFVDVFDKEKKGFLAEADRARMTPYGGHFKMMDRDNDGRLTQNEFVAYFQRMSALQVRATASCVSLVFVDAGRGLFDLLDADHNGTLTVHEMLQAPKLLERFDKSGKGYLTEHDLPRSWHLMVRRGPAGGLGFSAIGDGGFSHWDLVRAPASQPKKGPLWFRQLDHNGDGYLSRREFLGTDEQFRQIDTDGDGLISFEEAEKVDALFRKRPEPTERDRNE
jgi:Ca2+-binding EF-hand superfamily protein